MIQKEISNGCVLIDLLRKRGFRRVRLNNLPVFLLIFLSVNILLHAYNFLILTDTSHPLHTDLSKAVSTSSTRANFKLLFSRTTSYRNSVLPYLSRLLVNPEQAPTELRRRLLQ